MDELKKQMTIIDLLDEVNVPPPMMMYFDYDSFELLDWKIEVLQRVKSGESIDDIEGSYSIFELLPEGQHWD